MTKNFSTFLFMSFSLVDNEMVPRSIDPVITQKNYSFPYFMMLYIKVHRTPAAHAKMIQSCKEFYVKKPVIVADFISVRNATCVLKYKNEELEHSFVNLNSKLWITFVISLREMPSNWPLFLSSIFCPKNATFIIDNDEHLNYANLEQFSMKGTFKGLYIAAYNIIDSDNLLVPIEDVAKLFPDADTIAMQVFLV